MLKNNNVRFNIWLNLVHICKITTANNKQENKFILYKESFYGKHISVFKRPPVKDL